MENIDKIITTHLVWEHGYVIYPKGDGRVEVPQIFIKQLDWPKNKEVFVQIKFGEIIVIKNKILNCDTVKFTNGRIRIPLNLLKKANLDKKTLYIISDSNYLIIRTYVDDTKDISYKVSNFISTLSDVQKEQLLSIFTNETIEKSNPNLILLDQNKPTVFRILGPAFTFPAIWCDNKIKIGSSKSSSQLYLIPGINIQKQNIESGFLLINESIFKNIQARVFQKIDTTASKNISVEVVLLYDIFVDGKFKTYINPLTSINQSIIDNTKKMCNNVSNFINENFAKEKIGDVSEKFPIFTRQIMERGENDPRKYKY